MSLKVIIDSGHGVLKNENSERMAIKISEYNKIKVVWWERIFFSDIIFLELM